jgi:hypothetical protein
VELVDSEVYLGLVVIEKVETYGCDAPCEAVDQ